MNLTCHRRLISSSGPGVQNEQLRVEEVRCQGELVRITSQRRRVWLTEIFSSGTLKDADERRGLAVFVAIRSLGALDRQTPPIVDLCAIVVYGERMRAHSNAL